METVKELKQKLLDTFRDINNMIQVASSLHNSRLNDDLYEARRNILRASNKVDDLIEAASHS